MIDEAQSRVGETVGNYRLLKPVGQGGMGVVYLAEHVYIGKRAAIKILHERYAGSDEAVRRFLREAWAASAINHPNIVDVTDFGETQDGSVFLVMEYLEGQPLDQMLRQQRRLDLLRTISIMNQVTSALGAAHLLGILHRDLKPENLLIDRRPGRRQLVRQLEDGSGTVPEKEGDWDYVKVLDFGVAKIISSGFQPCNHGAPAGNVLDSGTMDDAILGTPEYMAPEVARAGLVDVRTDIYAAGVMFYEMLTGTVPIEGDTPMETLVLQYSEQVEPPRQRAPDAEITEAAERTILKALAKNPDDRHQSMAELYDDLQDCYGRVRYQRQMRRRPSSIPPTPVTEGAAGRADRPILLLRSKKPASPPQVQPIPLTRVKRSQAVASPLAPAPPRRKTLSPGMAPVMMAGDDGAGADDAAASRPRSKTLPIGSDAPLRSRSTSTRDSDE